jgi:ribosomal protein L40E
VTTARTWADIVDAIHRRFPGTTADAVAAAIEAAGLTQCGLARFVNRLQESVGAEWPKAAMTGEVAYRLAVALHEAGILDRVPPCTHCGRPRMVNSRGSAPPTCGACGPRNADGTKARSADPGKSMCPAGFHRLPAYTLRCDACADEADTALLQDAVLQVGASAELARTVISDVLLSRMSRRRVAEWLRAGRSLDQGDAPPPLVQQLRHALAAELPSVSRVRCACCGSERRVLPHQGEDGRICENCYRRTPGRIETCRSCRKERARLLAQLAAGETEITHAALDALPQSKPLHHLRHMLAHTGVLPERTEYLERIGPWLDNLLADQAADDSSLIRAYAQWDVLRRARQREPALIHLRRRPPRADDDTSCPRTAYLAQEPRLVAERPSARRHRELAIRSPRQAQVPDQRLPEVGKQPGTGPQDNRDHATA